jgi:hypothetical protein
VTAVVCVPIGPVDEDAAEFASLGCAGASGRERLVVGVVNLVVGVQVGAVEENPAEFVGHSGSVAAALSASCRKLESLMPRS